MFGKALYIHITTQVSAYELMKWFVLQDFSKNIKDLSIKTNKSITSIKNNIYREIAIGGWWKVDKFFQQFQQIIDGNDHNMEKSIDQGKYNKFILI